jgi:hypothetical protein
MEQQQQQQQGSIIHQEVLNGIARLTDPNRSEEDKHKLSIYGGDGFDRHSWQHVVDFLDNGDGSHEVIITELELDYVEPPDAPDGGLEVLRTFFARSDTTLTKVTLYGCNFGQAEDALELLAALQTNRTVSDDHSKNPQPKGCCTRRLLFWFDAKHAAVATV